VRRGSLSVWLTEEAISAWHAPATRARGGQAISADIAIETGLALRLVLHQPLRQTEGALRSIADLFGVQIRIPDHFTLSRHSGGLNVLLQRIERNEPLHLLIDSMGVRSTANVNGSIRNTGPGPVGAGASCISRSTPRSMKSPRWN
jgi:hypothetical protein